MDNEIIYHAVWFVNELQLAMPYLIYICIKSWSWVKEYNDMQLIG